MENKSHFSNSTIVKQFDALEKSATQIRAKDLTMMINRLSSSSLINDQKQMINSHKIIDINCQTGRTTSLLLEKFPRSVVIGIDSNESMVQWAKNHYNQKQLDHRSNNFICADINRSDFCQNLKNVVIDHDTIDVSNRFDLIFSIHSFSLMDPNIDIIMSNFGSLLKPNGVLCATFSFWCDLFRIGNEIIQNDQHHNQIQIPNQFKYKMFEPDWSNEIEKLKHLCRKNQFDYQQQHQNNDDYPNNLFRIELIKQRIEFPTLKRIQDCLRFIYPLAPYVSESQRLRFFSQFFDNVYDYSMIMNCCEQKSPFKSSQQQPHLEHESDTYHLTYQYIMLNTIKTSLSQ